MQATYALQLKNIEIIGYINILPEVNFCTINGSRLNGNADKCSDIDIEVDVSGSDNSVFVKKLPELLGKRFPVIWQDYAPSLAPELYIVSIKPPKQRDKTIDKM